MKGLPDFQFSFVFDEKGSETGKRFLGDFTYERPTIRKSSDIEKFKTQLDGDLKNIEVEMSFVHKMLAYLRHTLISYPKWWEESDFGLDMMDVNILMSLYKKVMDFEKQFVKKIPEKVEEAVKKNSEEAGDGK